MRHFLGWSANYTLHGRRPEGSRIEDVRRPIGLVGLAVLVLSCSGESPTEPAPLASDAATAPAARRRGSTTLPRELPPPCAAPARLRLSSCPTAGYMIAYREGTDVERRTEELARRFGFRPRHVWPTGVPLGFSAILSVETMTALRCEPDIVAIEEVTSIACCNLPSPCRT